MISADLESLCVFSVCMVIHISTKHHLINIFFIISDLNLCKKRIKLCVGAQSHKYLEFGSWLLTRQSIWFIHRGINNRLYMYIWLTFNPKITSLSPVCDNFFSLYLLCNLITVFLFLHLLAHEFNCVSSIFMTHDR